MSFLLLIRRDLDYNGNCQTLKLVLGFGLNYHQYFVNIFDMMTNIFHKLSHTSRFLRIYIYDLWHIPPFKYAWGISLKPKIYITNERKAHMLQTLKHYAVNYISFSYDISMQSTPTGSRHIFSYFIRWRKTIKILSLVL